MACGTPTQKGMQSDEESNDNLLPPTIARYTSHSHTRLGTNFDEFSSVSPPNWHVPPSHR